MKSNIVLITWIDMKRQDFENLREMKSIERKEPPLMIESQLGEGLLEPMSNLEPHIVIYTSKPNFYQSLK